MQEHCAKMFTNMLAPHHHRPPSPVTAATTLSCNTYATEQKYTPLHNAADAMRRHCMTSPVAYSVRHYLSCLHFKNFLWESQKYL